MDSAYPSYRYIVAHTFGSGCWTYTIYILFKITPECIDLADIISIANNELFRTQKSLISGVISIVPLRIKIALLREAEVQSINENMGKAVSCSISDGKCVIDSSLTQKKVVIALDSGYPIIPGPRGLHVITYYPYFRYNSGEDAVNVADDLQKLIISENIKSVTEFIEKCMNVDSK